MMRCQEVVSRGGTEYKITDWKERPLKGEFISRAASGIVERLPSRLSRHFLAAECRRGMTIEAQIYRRLGPHRRLVEIIDWDPDKCCLTMENECSSFPDSTDGAILKAKTRSLRGCSSFLDSTDDTILNANTKSLLKAIEWRLLWTALKNEYLSIYLSAHLRAVPTSSQSVATLKAFSRRSSTCCLLLQVRLTFALVTYNAC